MERDVARKVPASLLERRKRVIRPYRKDYRPMQIVELAGLSWGAVNAALKLYKEGGMAALKPSKRGVESGLGRTLDDEQEKRIQQLICEKRPEQLKMDFALWTRGAVKELILRECAVDLPVRTVGDYLHRRGFTPQKPIKRAYEQQPLPI